MQFYLDADGKKIRFGEVQFYFLKKGEGDTSVPTALVSLYGEPHVGLLEKSFGTLHACKYRGLDDLVMIPVSYIISVVSMQPLPLKEPGKEEPELLEGDWRFVIEKLGLDDIGVGGSVEPLE